jgi:hypothetical protein
MRRSRSKKNRNPKMGVRNRTKGAIKKMHQLKAIYGCKVVLYIEPQDDVPSAYESEGGLLQRISSFSLPESQVFNPNKLESASNTPGSTTDAPWSSPSPTPSISSMPSHITLSSVSSSHSAISPAPSTTPEAPDPDTTAHAPQLTLPAEMRNSQSPPRQAVEAQAISRRQDIFQLFLLGHCFD